MTLINGLLFCCREDIFVFDMDLERVGHIPAKDMERVRQVSQLTDGDLIAAASKGLFQLSYNGKVHLNCLDIVYFIKLR